MKNFILVIVLAACFVGCSSKKSNPGSASGGGSGGDDGPTPSPTPAPQKIVCHYIPDETSDSSLSNCDTIVVHGQRVVADIEMANFGGNTRARCELLLRDFKNLESLQTHYQTLNPNSDEAIRILRVIETQRNRLKSAIEVQGSIGKVTFYYDTNSLNSSKEKIENLYSDKNVVFATSQYVDAKLEVRESFIKDGIEFLSVSTNGLSKSENLNNVDGSIAIYDFNLLSNSLQFQIESNQKFLCDELSKGSLKNSLQELIKISQHVTYQQNNQSITKTFTN